MKENFTYGLMKEGLVSPASYSTFDDEALCCSDELRTLVQITGQRNLRRNNNA